MKRSPESSIRSLLSGKLDRPTVRNGRPLQNEGNDGDFTVRQTASGTHMFVRMNGQWYKIVLRNARQEYDITSGGYVEWVQSSSNGQRSIKPDYGTGLELENIALEVPSVKLKSKSQSAILLKTNSGVLEVRDNTDSDDAIVHAKKVKVSGVAAAANEIGKGSDSTHGNKFLTVHDGSAYYHTVMMNDSGVIDTSPAGLALKILDTNIAFYDNGDASKGMNFNIEDVSTSTTRTLKCPDANGTIALTSDIVTNHITNNAADVMTVSDFGANAALKIDADQPATTGAEDSAGLHIDYDRTVASSGTAAHNDIGIDLDVNSASLGTSSVKGMDINVVGATTGVHTAYGIDIDVSGADANVGLNITGPDGATGRRDIRLISSTDGGDFCVIYTGVSGQTFIQTTDSGGVAAHLNLDIDGDIILDSASGNFIAKKAGTEFSVADSSYAGMILGYSYFRNTDTVAGDDVIEIDTTMTVLQTTNGNDIAITFKAPPSGNVEIVFSAMVYGSSKEILFALSDNASYNELNQIHTYDNYSYKTDETDYDVVYIPWVLTGLTAGTSYTYYVAADASSNYAYIYHGSNRMNLHTPPIIVKATALPGTMTTGT